MAGEIEDPFSISFQTDSLHSGSISFGRFENEPLAWERRSSFSHNRYLEEVEKCSKPGSVIEKKAYFEAHFKRKALLLQGSSECENANEGQPGENDVLENEYYRDEFDNVTEGSHYDQFHESAFDKKSHDNHFDESILESVNCIGEFGDGNEGSQLDFANESSQFTHFDENLEGAKYQGELDMMEWERDGHSVLPAESKMEAALVNANDLVNIIPEEVNSLETHQNIIACGKSLQGSDEAGTELHKNLNDDTVDVNESSNAINLSPKSGTTEKVGKSSSENKKNLSLKSRVPVESKSTKQKLSSQGRVQQHSPLEATKTTAKNQNRREKESPGRMKAEKQSLRTSTPVRLSSQRSPKTEDSKNSATKSKFENKSEKEQIRAKKVVESQSFTLKKTDPRPCQITNRPKQTTDSTKPVVKPSAAAFSFKSDERAERRKEFFMKLEEKMHAKEAEMSQIQAKTQEKTQAEIKQLRKSLNFKATPMPSFYQVAALPGSDGNKAPAKIRHKSTSPGTKGTTRSPMFSRAGKDRAPSVSEFVNIIDKPESSEASKCSTAELSEVSSAPRTQSSSNQEARMKNGNPERKQREKERSPSVQKYRVSESCKVTKDQRSELKPKVGGRRNSNEMTRKSMKGISIGSSSGMSRLAVGVAS